MKISISAMLIFTTLVVLQIRIEQFKFVGIVVSLLCVPTTLLVMMVSAFSSESKKGRLAIEDNPAFQFWKKLLWLCLIDLAVLWAVNVVKFIFWQ